MYLIDKTYFRNKLEIIGLYDDNNKSLDKLNDYISIYVVNFLQELLGSEDFEELDSNIDAGLLDPLAPQKWLDFINGKSYVLNGKTYIWKGLIYSQGSVKLSILTNIVYCELMQDLFTNNGKATITTKNSIQAIPNQNYNDAYNEIVKQFQDETFFKKVYNFHGVIFTDYYGSEKSNYVTLSQYFKDHESDFENVNFCVGYNDFKNAFDL